MAKICNLLPNIRLTNISRKVHVQCEKRRNKIATSLIDNIVKAVRKE